MNNQTRVVVAALTISAAAFVGRVTHEGFTDTAVIPTKGDVPTVGFGMTKRPDGSPVQMGDRVKPVEALQRSLVHMQRDEQGLKACVKVELHQAEYDMLLDHAYQYGVGRTCGSSIVRFTNERKYKEACDAYLAWRFMGTFDCSIPGNTRCGGVWKDAQRRQDICLKAQ